MGTWHCDLHQIDSILEIWKEENGNVDPCTIKDLLQDLSPEGGLEIYAKA